MTAPEGLVDQERRSSQQALGVVGPGEARAHQRSSRRKRGNIRALLRGLEEQVSLDHHGESLCGVAGGEPVRAVEQDIGVNARYGFRSSRVVREALEGNELLGQPVGGVGGAHAGE